MTPTPTPAIFFLRGTKILAGLRHYKKENGTWSVWTVPAGCPEGDEDLMATLKREVKEETGITEFSVEGQIGVVPGADTAFDIHLYVGMTAQEARLMEPEKFSEWRWIDVNEMPTNFINPAALEILRAYLAR